MRQFVSILLIGLLLVSSTQVAYATHSCAGEVVKSQVVWGSNDLNCGMFSSSDRIGNPISKSSVEKKSCCANQIYSVDTDENFSTSSSLIISFATTILINIESVIQFDISKADQPHFSNHSPPIPNLDFQVKYQVFLI